MLGMRECQDTFKTELSNADSIYVRDSDQSPSDEPMQHLTGRTETAVTTVFTPIPRSALRDELAINAEDPRAVGVTVARSLRPQSRSSVEN